MTSTITGTLKDLCRLYDILQALFPCGSITGAPKVSTMAIINRLEPKPRGVYCGSIGICLPDGRRVFNVAIRTIQLSHNQADRKSTRLNSSHANISYAVFCL